ncbi:hypothetical protein [Chakrabartyella piscis]|uniref:hypothetical protein n=1 Tax=Chakrabartyella piscis TaxID=2918914 RepID=UPI0029583BAD|nr:hypothetical protein [Chakrabartyella piscis]
MRQKFKKGIAYFLTMSMALSAMSVPAFAETGVPDGAPSLYFADGSDSADMELYTSDLADGGLEFDYTVAVQDVDNAKYNHKKDGTWVSSNGTYITVDVDANYDYSRVATVKVAEDTPEGDYTVTYTRPITILEDNSEYEAEITIDIEVVDDVTVVDPVTGEIEIGFNANQTTSVAQNETVTKGDSAEFTYYLAVANKVDITTALGTDPVFADFVWDDSELDGTGITLVQSDNGVNASATAYVANTVAEGTYTFTASRATTDDSYYGEFELTITVEEYVVEDTASLYLEDGSSGNVITLTAGDSESLYYKVGVTGKDEDNYSYSNDGSWTLTGDNADSYITATVENDSAYSRVVNVTISDIAEGTYTLTYSREITAVEGGSGEAYTAEYVITIEVVEGADLSVEITGDFAGVETVEHVYGTLVTYTIEAEYVGNEEGVVLSDWTISGDTNFSIGSTTYDEETGIYTAEVKAKKAAETDAVCVISITATLGEESQTYTKSIVVVDATDFTASFRADDGTTGYTSEDVYLASGKTETYAYYVDRVVSGTETSYTYSVPVWSVTDADGNLTEDVTISASNREGTVTVEKTAAAGTYIVSATVSAVPNGVNADGITGIVPGTLEATAVAYITVLEGVGTGTIEATADSVAYDEGGTVEYTLDFTELEGSTYTYTWTVSPTDGNVSIDKTGTTETTVTVAEGATVGDYTIKCAVKELTDGVTQTVNVTTTLSVVDAINLTAAFKDNKSEVDGALVVEGDTEVLTYQIATSASSSNNTAIYNYEYAYTVSAGETTYDDIVTPKGDSSPHIALVDASALEAGTYKLTAVVTATLDGVEQVETITRDFEVVPVLDVVVSLVPSTADTVYTVGEFTTEVIYYTATVTTEDPNADDYTFTYEWSYDAKGEDKFSFSAINTSNVATATIWDGLAVGLYDVTYTATATNGDAVQVFSTTESIQVVDALDLTLALVGDTSYTSATGTFALNQTVGLTSATIDEDYSYEFTVSVSPEDQDITVGATTAVDGASMTAAVVGASVAPGTYTVTYTITATSIANPADVQVGSVDFTIVVEDNALATIAYWNDSTLAYADMVIENDAAAADYRFVIKGAPDDATYEWTLVSNVEETDVTIKQAANNLNVGVVTVPEGATIGEYEVQGQITSGEDVYVLTSKFSVVAAPSIEATDFVQEAVSNLKDSVASFDVVAVATNGAEVSYVAVSDDFEVVVTETGFDVTVPAKTEEGTYEVEVTLSAERCVDVVLVAEIVVAEAIVLTAELDGEVTTSIVNDTEVKVPYTVDASVSDDSTATYTVDAGDFVVEKDGYDFTVVVPEDTAEGTYTVTVTVSAEGCDSQTFTAEIVVSAPIVYEEIAAYFNTNSSFVSVDSIAAAGDTLKFSAKLSNVDTDAVDVTYDWSGSEGIEVNPLGANNPQVGVLAVDENVEAGTYEVSVVISADGYNSTTLSLKITIEEPEEVEPEEELEAIDAYFNTNSSFVSADYTAVAGETLKFSAKLTTTDATNVTYAWSGSEGIEVNPLGANNPQVGVLVVDDSVAAGTYEVSVVISADNYNPTTLSLEITIEGSEEEEEDEEVEDLPEFDLSEDGEFTSKTPTMDDGYYVYEFTYVGEESDDYTYGWVVTGLEEDNENVIFEMDWTTLTIKIITSYDNVSFSVDYVGTLIED